MTNHISTVTKSACFFHLRRIRQIKRCLNEKCLRTLVQALVIYPDLTTATTTTATSDQPTRHHTSSIYHYPPHCCTTRQKLAAKGSHHPSSSATPLASHQSANLIQNLCPHVQHPFRIMSALYVILGHTVHNSRIEIESPIICQKRLRNSAHVQLIWSTSVRSPLLVHPSGTI